MNMSLVVFLAIFCGVSNAEIWNGAVQNSAHSAGQYLSPSAADNNLWMKYEGPIALPQGYDKYGAPLPVQDTPEVAHAKAIQLAEIVKAGGDIHPSYGPDKSAYEHEDPIAAKHAHEAAVQHAKAEIAHALYQQYELISKFGPTAKYYGPQAQPAGYKKNGAPLPVEDTPEVAHVKAKQLAALAKAGGDIQPAVYGGEESHYGGTGSSYSSSNSWAGGAQLNPWAGGAQLNQWAGGAQSNPWAGSAQSNPWAGGAQSNPWAGGAQSNSWAGGAQSNPWASRQSNAWAASSSSSSSSSSKPWA